MNPFRFPCLMLQAVLFALALLPGLWASPSSAEFKPIVARVEVYDEQNKPLVSAQVWAVSHDYGFRVNATTDSAGKAELKIMPGTWSFFASMDWGEMWKRAGKGYLLAQVGTVLTDQPQSPIRLAPAKAMTLTVSSSAYNLDTASTYVAFAVEPFGRLIPLLQCAGLRNRSATIYASASLTASACIIGYMGSDGALIFSTPPAALGSDLAIDINAQNSGLLEFPMPNAASDGSLLSLALNGMNSPSLTYDNPGLATTLSPAQPQLRLSPGDWHIPRILVAGTIPNHWALTFEPLTIYIVAGHSYSFSLGADVKLSFIRTIPRPKISLVPGCQIMAYLTDQYGNPISQYSYQGNWIYPVFKVIDSDGIHTPDMTITYGRARLPGLYPREKSPRYEISWNHGPFGSGQATGMLYGSDERLLRIEETPHLIGYGSRIDQARYLRFLNWHEKFQTSMTGLLGVPVDHKQLVTLDLATSGFEDEFNMGYAVGMWVLDFNMDFPPGDAFLDHEAAHGRNGMPPANFAAILTYGEAYVSFMAHRARASQFGDERLFLSYMGGYDMFLRYQHQPWPLTNHDRNDIIAFIANYITRHYGWDPSRRMIMEWQNSFLVPRQRLESAGYSDVEQFAIINSYFCHDNLGDLFEASGFPVTSSRVADGLALVKNYTECLGAAALAVGSNKSPLSIPSFEEGLPVRSSTMSIPVNFVGAPTNVSSLEFVMHYDPASALAEAAYRRDLTYSSDWGLTSDLRTSGVARLRLQSAGRPLSLGAVAQVNFRLLPNAKSLVVNLTDVRINGQQAPESTGEVPFPTKPIIGPFPILPACEPGQIYSSDLWAIAGKPPYHYEVVEDTLPPGLSLDANSGRIAGVCGGAGEYVFRIRASDNGEQYTHRWFRITVASLSGCIKAISPELITLDRLGGKATFNVSASQDTCPRNVATDSEWLRVTSGQYGVGSGVIEVSAEANLSGSARTGWITVAGLRSKVIQAASSPPAAATLISPNGALQSPNPTYLWNADSTATWYQLWVDDSAGTPRLQAWFTAAQAGCAFGTVTCSITPTTALAFGSCQWWIQTWNDAGYGPWSNGMKFTVIAGGIPGKAMLVSPSGTITTTTPTYIWNAVPSASWYYLWVNDSTGTPKIQTWYTAAQAGCAFGGICSVTPSRGLAAGSGQWWMQTWNIYGYGLWSDPLSFAVTAGSSSVIDK